MINNGDHMIFVLSHRENIALHLMVLGFFYFLSLWHIHIVKHFPLSLQKFFHFKLKTLALTS